MQHLLAALVLSLCVSTATAQETQKACGDVDTVLLHLKTSYDEIPRGLGKINDGALLILTKGPDLGSGSTATLVVVNSSTGEACLVMALDGWRDLPAPKGKEVAP